MRTRTLLTPVLTACLLLALAPAAGAADPVLQDACPESLVPPSSFGDVPDGPHAHAVDCVAWYGVARGTSDGLFSPDGLVRRDQMAGFLARALTELRADLPPGEGRFRDLEGNPHRDDIERLAAAGVVNGSGDGTTYRPELPLTRGQAATLLWRSLVLLAPERLTDDDNGGGVFADTAGDAHERNIGRAWFWGLIRGRTEPAVSYDPGSGVRHVQQGVFGPLDLLRRDQMASLLARLLSRGSVIGRGGWASSYPAGEPVLLRDGWELTWLGNDPDAGPELRAADPSRADEERALVLVRVRATYRGEGTSTFDGAERLGAATWGYSPEWEGGTDPFWHATDRPCGDIPFELPNPETETGGTVEGNLCFAHDGSYPDGAAPSPAIVDLRWGSPTRPHFGGDFLGRDRDPQEELVPYVPPTPR